MAGARVSTSKAKALVAADVVTAAKAALDASAARKAVRAQPADAEPLSAADRENPEKLAGEALRALAHRRGVSRSEAEGMSDEKLRMQLRYITHRQYAED